MPNKGASIDVDRGHGLGLINDQITATLQIHAARQRPPDFFFDRIQVKQGAFARIPLQLIQDLGLGHFTKGFGRLERLTRVNPHHFGILLNQIAAGP